MSQGTFSDTLTRLEAFKRTFFLRPKIDIFPRRRSRVFAKKNKKKTKTNFKSAVLTCLCS